MYCRSKYTYGPKSRDVFHPAENISPNVATAQRNGSNFAASEMFEKLLKIQFDGMLPIKIWPIGHWPRLAVAKSFGVKAA